MENRIDYTIPRPLYEVLVEKLGDRNAAEQFAASIEEAVRRIGLVVHRETIEKTGMVKTDIMKELSETLVTRDVFEERFESMQNLMDRRFSQMQEQTDVRFHLMHEQMDARFQAMNEQIDIRFQSTQEQMNIRFQAIQDHVDQRFALVDERFRRIDLKFNILIGILLFGFTLFNPSFLELVKVFVK